MKFKRTERIGAIVKILSDNPNKISKRGFSRRACYFFVKNKNTFH